MLTLKIRTLFTPGAYNLAALREATAAFSSANGFVLGCLLCLSGVSFFLEWLSVVRRDQPYYFLCQPAVLIGLVLLTVALSVGKSNEFIYFAF